MFRIITPVDGSVYLERTYADRETIDYTLNRAQQAQNQWQETTIKERAMLCRRFIDTLLDQQESLIEEIAWQVGRPITQIPEELERFQQVGNYMIDIAADALQEIDHDFVGDTTRFIRRDPLGVILIIGAWNYPYLSAVDTIIPALMAGNAVILKHAEQVALCAERLHAIAREINLPDGVFQYLHAPPEAVLNIVGDERVDFCTYTGPVEWGQHIQQAAGMRFVGTTMLLSGKDPAYVCADADLDMTIPAIVRGCFNNAGQSRCAVKRIYVDASRYDDFLDGFAALTRRLVLGNPFEPETTLGPLIGNRSAEYLRAQVTQAVNKGASHLVEPAHFQADERDTPYLAPQVLVNVDHDMRVMREESFGPVVSIMRVESENEAIALMNDSDYGLTASVWTQDETAAIRIGAQVATGTFYMNACDYLDPSLTWTGIKKSGRGYTLSPLGYDQFTRPKSFYLKT